MWHVSQVCDDSVRFCLTSYGSLWKRVHLTAPQACDWDKLTCYLACQQKAVVAQLEQECVCVSMWFVSLTMKVKADPTSIVLWKVRTLNHGNGHQTLNAWNNRAKKGVCEERACVEDTRGQTTWDKELFWRNCTLSHNRTHVWEMCALGRNNGGQAITKTENTSEGQSRAVQKLSPAKRYGYSHSFCFTEASNKGTRKMDTKEK